MTSSTSRLYTFSPPVTIMSFLRSTIVEVAVLVGAAEVAAVEPPADERLLVGLGAAPVAAHHLVALDDDLAHLAHGDVVHVVVHEANAR